MGAAGRGILNKGRIPIETASEERLDVRSGYAFLCIQVEDHKARGYHYADGTA